MVKIVKGEIEYYDRLTEIGIQTFIESHGKSASKEDVDEFLTKNYSCADFKRELANSENKYQIIYFENQMIGYSKIVLNVPNKNINQQHITKLDRLYILKEFYGKNVGNKLLDFNIELSKTNKQKGMWLAVWVENYRAINFYKKNNFTIVGSYDFKISRTHSNPNHIMYLQF